MSDFKSVMKGGWHPKGKDGGKESWRGDFKGINQVAGWMGKGKQPGEDKGGVEHVSRPLAALKDPASFGPPPKNVNYHGGAALPNEITPHTGGLGAPLTQEQIASSRAATNPYAVNEAATETQQKAPPPPLPYRADTTGKRTDQFLPPPVHRDLNNSSPVQQPQSSRATPNLPPRLPSRQNTTSPPAQASPRPGPPPSYESATNESNSYTPTQSAISRLGNAGVSVPGFGIGKKSNNEVASPSINHTNPWRNEPSQNDQGNSSQISELQSRFGRMNTSFLKQNQNNTTNDVNSTSPSNQSQPPSWQQTRSALTTANSAYKDPSNVSLADAQNAAQTAQSAQKSANAFREQHNETISAAKTRATQLNKKYNMTGRLNKYLEDANNAHDKQEEEARQQATTQQPQQQPQQQQQQPQQQQLTSNPWQNQKSPVSSPPPVQATSQTPLSPSTSSPQPVNTATSSISRKPPPPPPPKKPASMQAPPPVPLGTKPNFG